MGIARIDRSLNSRYWETETTLHKRRGYRVFYQGWRAVLILRRLTEYDGSFTAGAQAAIDLLVQADQTLAQVALDTAINGGGNPERIRRAQTAMDRAAQTLANGRPGWAILYYQAAWQHAVRAQ